MLSLSRIIKKLLNKCAVISDNGKINASVIEGTLNVSNIPPAALERLITVANQTARFALTKTQVQNGDTIKQIDTGVMYLVIDDTNLNNAAGYTEYTAGTATKAKCDENGNDIASTYVKKTDTIANAAAAEKLKTARTITLIGKASGSTTFDGSGNVSINVSSVTADSSASTNSVNWNNITNKPSTFTPTAHNHDSSYPALNGTRAIGTWPISIAGNAATASKVTTTVAAGQVAAIAHAIVGGDDGVAIRAGSTGNNAGYLELATAGDGNEPIYARQYSSGAGDSESSFTTAARTVTLLDSNGNTSFPGTLTASKIYNAVYNDYAEFFEKAANTAFEPGDIIALDMDSEKEQYVKATENSIVIVGVVTDEYAHIIGGEKGSLEKNEKKYIPVSLMGRVHVKVDDTVKRGDKITASSIPGIGRKAKPNEHSIGTALMNPVNGKTRILINI